MGRPIGSVNRQKPFADALRLEIGAGNDPRRLRAIARKLIEMAEGGDLQAIKEVGDRLDGKCAQVIERGDVPGGDDRPAAYGDQSRQIARTG